MVRHDLLHCHQQRSQKAMEAGELRIAAAAEAHSIRYTASAGDDAGGMNHDALCHTAKQWLAMVHAGM